MQFAGSAFLTFNYDSLAEIFLHRHEAWYPHDGYGIPIETQTYSHEVLEQRSRSRVLHLHGSSCVRTATYTFTRQPGSSTNWYTPYERPRYLFDAGATAMAFPRYRRTPPSLGFQRPEERVIAPVPDKAKHLKKEFIEEMYRLARRLLGGAAHQLVAIGYSFNLHDRASFGPLLSAMSAGSEVLLVSPDAERIQKRIVAEYPDLSLRASSHGFADWVEAGYPALAGF